MNQILQSIQKQLLNPFCWAFNQSIFSRIQSNKFQGVDVSLFWKNENPSECVSILPTSSITGDGISQLLNYMIVYTQSHLRDRFVSHGAFECSVLDVITVPGVGVMINVLLVNGHLRFGDMIMLSGEDGFIVTTIRRLMTLKPLNERSSLDVSVDYIN